MPLPNTPWDWPHNTGSMAPELFRFADTIPASITPNTQYAPSSDSFATNYRSFLEFIDARRFPDPAALATAKACIRAWGQLALATGSWYNSALMQLGRPYVPNAGTFFGPGCLLRGRVSGFLAAYQAKYRYAAPGPIGARLATDLNRAGRISAFGQPVALVGPPVRADQAEVLLASDAASPVIVAALLEAF